MSRETPSDLIAGRVSSGPSPLLYLWLALGVLAFVVLSGGFSGGLASSHADQGAKKVKLAYVSVVGEGPIARAWYDGAPSPGVQVQAALDHFAELGYVVVRTTDALRSAVKPEDSSFAIILQRVR